MFLGKIFKNGGSQAVRLPKECSFSDNSDTVVVKKMGDMVIIVPADSEWSGFFEGLEAFTDDFLAEGRKQPAWGEENISLD